MPTLFNQPELAQGEPVSSCPSCGNASLRIIGPLPEAFHFCAFYYRHPINRGNLVGCSSCDLHFRNPCLPPNILEDLYRKQPATVWGTVTEGRSDVPLILPLFDQTARSEIRILDVGCYTGGLLQALRTASPRGKSIRCFGIEPSSQAAKHASGNGIEILGPTIDRLSTSQNFDLILLTDVFEHVLDAKGFLRKLCRHLNPGGHLVIITGAFDSAPFQRFLNTYNYAATPEHVAFISARHAKWLAEKLGLLLNRYEVISHTPFFPSKLKRWGKTAAFRIFSLLPTAWLCIDWAPISRLTWLRGLGVQNLSGQPDHAFVVMQRPLTDHSPL